MAGRQEKSKAVFLILHCSEQWRYIRQLVKPFLVLVHWAHKLFIMLFFHHSFSACVNVVFWSCQRSLNPGSLGSSRCHKWNFPPLLVVLSGTMLEGGLRAVLFFDPTILLLEYTWERLNIGGHVFLLHWRGTVMSCSGGTLYLSWCPHIGCFCLLLLSWYTCLQPQETDQCLDKFPRTGKKDLLNIKNNRLCVQWEINTMTSDFQSYLESVLRAGDWPAVS